MRFDGWQFAEVMAYIFGDESDKQNVIQLVEERKKNEDN